LKNWIKWLEGAQFIGLAIMLIGLSVSNFLMSLSGIWLSAVFVLHLINDFFSGKNIRVRLRQFTSSGYAVIFASFYFALLIGMLWSDDWSYGLRDLKIKLPMLIMPVVISTLNPISEKAIRKLFILFISSLCVATLLCLSVYWGKYNSLAHFLSWKEHDVNDIRDISIFISHIRFSLLLVVAICILSIHFFARNKERFISILVIGLFVYFLWVVESITGFTILFVLIFGFLLFLAFHSERQWLKMTGIAGILLFVSAIFFFGMWIYRDYYKIEAINVQQLDEYSSGGERYEHHPEIRQVENGHYVMVYIAWGEMSDAWRAKSSKDIEAVDASGNVLKGTLIRYLSSRGLRKDKEGVAQLSENDVKQIEAGVPSVTWENKNGLELRLERIMFEYNSYIDGENPSGHSVFQRLEFWKTGWGIIKEHPNLGVGTGDVANAFVAQYEAMDSPLERTYWLRAHNQYLTFWISIGWIGLSWFLFVLSYPLRIKAYRNNKVYMCFWVTVVLSFLTEDTLESQAGVSFFVFLTCFLIFLPRKGGAGRTLILD